MGRKSANKRRKCEHNQKKIRIMTETIFFKGKKTRINEKITG